MSLAGATHLHELYTTRRCEKQELQHCAHSELEILPIILKNQFVGMRLSDSGYERIRTVYHNTGSSSNPSNETAA